MVKPFRLLLLAGLGIGAWFFFSNYRIRGWEKLSVEPADSPGASDSRGSSSLPLSQRTIRIAAANFGPLDQTKLAKQQVAGCLVQIIRRFEVVALQDIEAPDQGLLVQLVEQVNATGRRYEFALPPTFGHDGASQYSAFVFDGDRVEIDRSTILSVDPRSGQFRRPPLAATFRARGPAAGEAFTFTLINVNTPSDRVDEELGHLVQLVRTVRDEGRRRTGREEDDILLLGTIGTDDAHLGPLQQLPGATLAIRGIPTTTRGNRQVDNILFDRRATVEFTYHSGVLDLRKEFDLTPQQEIEISDHCPVWAEFSVFEGGDRGRGVGTGS